MNYSGRPDFEPTELPILTRTERRCLELIALGWNDDRIGAELVLTASEVRTIVSVAVSKLEVNNRMAAIAKATRLGMLEI